MAAARHTWRGVALGALVLAAVACKSANDTKGSRQSPAPVCTKAGQSCEYVPGKIGLCTARVDGCDGGACLTCMSLH